MQECQWRQLAGAGVVSSNLLNNDAVDPALTGMQEITFGTANLVAFFKYFGGGACHSSQSSKLFHANLSTLNEEYNEFSTSTQLLFNPMTS